ncbi:MAG: hypothetical protein HZA08_07375 [Nitrospirae bacterium]|nr:hypothetical protein [Nitrospirota bacterium]
MTPEQKAWIDAASYKQLLEKWRFAPIKDAFFQGECGDYYQKVMREKRDKITDAERVQASKDLEWG